MTASADQIPRALLPPQFREFTRIPIRIGGLEVSDKQVMMDTVLGSCIATCLFDTVAGIGGMNHFMLPESMDSNDPTSTRYGVYAMELLINKLMKAGGQRRWFEAKIFGGGHVLNVKKNLDSEDVPQRNIEFVRNFLLTENIPVVKEDVGGYHPRRVLFNPKSGKVYMKRLDASASRKTAEEEIRYLESFNREKMDGDTTIF